MNGYLLPCRIYNCVTVENNKSIKEIRVESVFKIVN